MEHAELKENRQPTNADGERAVKQIESRAQVALSPPDVFGGFSVVLGEIRAQESAGQAELAIQGYYMSGSGQSMVQTSGMAENSTQFIEGLGLLSTNVEGYGGAGFHAGNLSAGLKELRSGDGTGTFKGGDFHTSSYLVESPFTNVYSPDIAGRGAQISMRRTNRTYQFFVGEDTVLAGPRIPFRLILPQRIIGASMQQKIGEGWTIGVRFMNLATSSSALTDDSTYFLPGRTYEGSNSLMFQSTYKVNEHLKLYGETGYGTVSGFTPLAVDQKPFSVLIGPSWETEKFSIRANYVRQSTSYMPLLGYFRRRPQRAVRRRPRPAIWESGILRFRERLFQQPGEEPRSAQLQQHRLHNGGFGHASVEDQRRRIRDDVEPDRA